MIVSHSLALFSSCQQGVSPKAGERKNYNFTKLRFVLFSFLLLRPKGVSDICHAIATVFRSQPHARVLIFLVSSSVSLYHTQADRDYQSKQVTPLKSHRQCCPALPPSTLSELWKTGYCGFSWWPVQSNRNCKGHTKAEGNCAGNTASCNDTTCTRHRQGAVLAVSLHE